MFNRIWNPYKTAQIGRLKKAIAEAEQQAGSQAPPRKRKWDSLARQSWHPGLSVIITERATPDLLEDCLRSLSVNAQQIKEAVQILVVLSDAHLEDYATHRSENPAVVWITSRHPLGFSQAIIKGLKQARHDWVYLLNSDMTLEPNCLKELLPLRSTRVFGIGSQIYLQDQTRRKEETGWLDFRFENGHFEHFHVAPEDALEVRGTFYTSGGASLFRTSLLRAIIDPSHPYDPFCWEDAEWGLRAWRSGYDNLFCPSSIVRHSHRGTVSRFFRQSAINRVIERNRVLFHLRNLPLEGSLEKACPGLTKLDGKSVRELTDPQRLEGIYCSRVEFTQYPCELETLVNTRHKHYSRARDDEKPRLIVVSPFVIYPPAHGGALRMHHLIRGLASKYDVVVLSDEREAYDKIPTYLAPLSSLHLLTGRTEEEHQIGKRVGRIESHSRKALAKELGRLLIAEQPASIQIEYIELSGLRDNLPWDGSIPWVLDLHDVLLGRDAEQPGADGYEVERIKRHDWLVVCSPDDKAMLPKSISNVSLIANGVDTASFTYKPSSGTPRILFAGPFRYLPNLLGTREFLEKVYPRLLEAFPELRFDILGGVDAPELATSELLFCQKGVTVHDRIQDVRPFLNRCTLTINPMTGIRGSSLKLIESLAAGRVCVSTQDASRGFLGDGFPGLVVAEQVVDFEKPILRLLGESSYRHDLEAPRRELLARYDWDHLGAALANLHSTLGTI